MKQRQASVKLQIFFTARPFFNQIFKQISNFMSTYQFVSWTELWYDLQQSCVCFDLNHHFIETSFMGLLGNNFDKNKTLFIYLGVPTLSFIHLYSIQENTQKNIFLCIQKLKLRQYLGKMNKHTSCHTHIMCKQSKQIT